MSYRFSSVDRTAPACRKGSPWQRSQLPETMGSCFTDRLAFDDGLSVIYTDFTPRHDLVEAGAVEQERSLTVAIAMAGRSSSAGKDDQRFDFVSGHSTIAVYGCLRGERRYPADQSIRQLRLVVKAPWLRRYGLESLLEAPGRSESASLLFRGRHGAATQRMAESLVHLHDHSDSLLDTHIAALGLLSEQIRPLAQTPTPTTAAPMRSADQDLVLRARDILMTRYDRPLTVSYLCATVGTNDFKLKQGFRTMFGTSPHRMLTGIRMDKALELLETGLQVSTVAYRVGYKHLSSFSAAFERHYGRTPTAVARPRKAA